MYLIQHHYTITCFIYLNMTVLEICSANTYKMCSGPFLEYVTGNTGCWCWPISKGLLKQVLTQNWRPLVHIWTSCMYVCLYVAWLSQDCHEYVMCITSSDYKSLQDMLFSFFHTMLLYCFQEEQDGWRVWVETTAAIHAYVCLCTNDYILSVYVSSLYRLVYCVHRVSPWYKNHEDITVRALYSKHAQ